MEILLSVLVITALVALFVQLRRSRSTAKHEVVPGRKPRLEGSFDDAFEELLEDIRSDTPIP